MPISGVSGYIAVRENDWLRLNDALKSIWSRLSNLEGKTGDSKRYADLSLEGNKLTNGPEAQKTAADAEFVTKAYLASAEGAQQISTGMANAGLSSSAVRIRTVDGGSSPSAPTMQQGELIVFTTTGETYLVYYTGQNRVYFTKSGQDLF
jgi:hypothetical protein